MSHAFEDILKRRSRRRIVVGRLLYLARKSSRRLVALAASALAVVLLAGIAEARQSTNALFEWPWVPGLLSSSGPTGWLLRLAEGGDRAVAPFTGLLLVLFCGAWLTVLSMAVLRFALRFGFGPLAIARTVIDEAVRNKTVIVVLSLLLICLAAWPYFTTTSAQVVPRPLRYQIQGFLSFSAMTTAALLGAVTILFAAYTVSTDINIRRTGDVFVKPLSRVYYLFGKWLGVISIMAVVLGVQCILVWGVAMLWLPRNPALDPLDMSAIYESVLTARSETIPQPPRAFEEIALEQLAVRIRDEPELVAQRGRSALFADMVVQQRSDFLKVEFRERKGYRFAGLKRARERALDLEKRIAASAEPLAAQLNALLPEGMQVSPQQVSLMTLAPFASQLGVDLRPGLIQLRFKVIGINDYASATGRIDLSLNGNTLPRPLEYVIDRVQIVDLPASYVDENGVLLVEFYHIYADSTGRERTIQFDTGTWIQVYHFEGQFGANLLRGTWIHLVRLAFLAMLGVITGSLWSFPVAATFSLCFWILAAGGAWLQGALAAPISDTDVMPVDTMINRVMLPIVGFLTRQLATYGKVNVGAMLADGRHIGSAAMLSQTFWVGLWMAALVALGGYLFWRREIARVQV